MESIEELQAKLKKSDDDFMRRIIRKTFWSICLYAFAISFSITSLYIAAYKHHSTINGFIYSVIAGTMLGFAVFVITEYVAMTKEYRTWAEQYTQGMMDSAKTITQTLKKFSEEK